MLAGVSEADADATSSRQTMMRVCLAADMTWHGEGDNSSIIANKLSIVAIFEGGVDPATLNCSLAAVGFCCRWYYYYYYANYVW